MNGVQKSKEAPERARTALLEKLKEAQRTHGSLSKASVSEIAQSMGAPLSEVYGVATFYSFLSIRPRGKYVIRICKSIPCCMKHSEMIIEGVAKTIGIKPGETTSDGKFTFELTNCIGACDMAPAMLLNDEVHGHLTPDKIASILKACV